MELTKINRSIEGDSTTFLRIVVAVAAVTVLATIVGCGFRKKPSTVVEDMIRTVERGEIDQAARFNSQGFVSRNGIDSIKESLRQTALWIKRDGGIKSIEVLKEDTVGDVAEVTIRVTRGGGELVGHSLQANLGEWRLEN